MKDNSEYSKSAIKKQRFFKCFPLVVMCICLKFIKSVFSLKFEQSLKLILTNYSFSKRYFHSLISQMTFEVHRTHREVFIVCSNKCAYTRLGENQAKLLTAIFNIVENVTIKICTLYKCTISTTNLFSNTKPLRFLFV